MIVTGESIKPCKQRGEWAELRFMARASEHGLCVSKPWGDSSRSRYDFVVDHEGNFLRVQVKSTTCRRNNSYICHLHSKRDRPYTKRQIDFVAAYIIPKNVWYIFPVDIISNSTSSLLLSPHMKVSKYGIYREAWHLMSVGEAASQPPIISRPATNPDEVELLP